MRPRAISMRVTIDSTTLWEVAAFVSAQTGGWMSVERVVDVITTIVSGPEGVLDLWRRGERVGVATLIDTCSTLGNAAELSMFVDAHASGSLGGDGEDVMDNLLAWAEERLRGSPRSNLDIPVWPGTTISETWLRRHGFLPYRMVS